MSALRSAGCVLFVSLLACGSDQALVEPPASPAPPPTPAIEAPRVGTYVASLGELASACERHERLGADENELLVVDFPAELSRGDDGVWLDTARNLRAFRGSAEFLPRDLEALVLPANGDFAAELTAEAQTVRVGFFLDFDRRGQACLLRSASAVSVIRFDWAFVEIYSESGVLLARQDTELLRAFEERGEMPELEVSEAVPTSVLEAISACVLSSGDSESGESTSHEALFVSLARRDGVWEVELVSRGVESEANESLPRCLVDALGSVTSVDTLSIRYTPH